MNKPNWKDAPEWANVLLTNLYNVYYAWAESYKDGSVGFDINGKTTFHLTKGDWKLVEHRPPKVKVSTQCITAVKREQHIQQMLSSYTDAIRQAGGDTDVFLDNIYTMTVAEMIDNLAQNGVRFVYDKQSMEK